MPNMSYCRFRNTLGDLQDCYDNMADGSELGDPNDRQSEAYARKNLISLCKKISEEFEE